MSTLVKARLEELTIDARGSTASASEEVQFNPTSLALSLTNETDGGRAKGQQRRQYLGKTSTELTLELVFDTADEGTAEAPRSVREKTAMVERFALPRNGGKHAPPKARFRWDRLIIDGFVESVSIDFDLFAANGTPLRAKVKLTLKEQNAKYDIVPSTSTGGGKDAALGAIAGAIAGASKGTTAGDKGADRAALALGGETPPEFAARVGLDPAAWRGLDADLGSGLSLEPGASVGFRHDLGVALGVGVRAGVRAGVYAVVEATLGLQGPGGGFALAAAGGVAAALDAAAAAHQTTAVAATRTAFAAPVSAPPQPTVDRTPLRIRGPRPITPEIPPPSPDLRATTFGRGVPLRDRFRGDLRDRPDTRRDPTRPPWEQLSPPASGSSSPRGAACRCACACTCKGPR